MTDVRNRVVQSMREVDAEDEEPLTAMNGETVRPGRYPEPSDSRPERLPPVAPPAEKQDDVARVEDALGRTGGAANHPDGPGVGGD